MKPCNRAAASACDTFTMLCTHPTSPDVSQDVSLEQEAVNQTIILSNLQSTLMTIVMCQGLHLIVCLSLQLFLKTDNVINHPQCHIQCPLFLTPTPRQCENVSYIVSS